MKGDIFSTAASSYLTKRIVAPLKDFPWRGGDYFVDLMISEEDTKLWKKVCHLSLYMVLLFYTLFIQILRYDLTLWYTSYQDLFWWRGYFSLCQRQLIRIGNFLTIFEFESVTVIMIVLVG